MSWWSIAYTLALFHSGAGVRVARTWETIDRKRATHNYHNPVASDPDWPCHAVGVTWIRKYRQVQRGIDVETNNLGGNKGRTESVVLIIYNNKHGLKTLCPMLHTTNLRQTGGHLWRVLRWLV